MVTGLKMWTLQKTLSGFFVAVCREFFILAKWNLKSQIYNSLDFYRVPVTYRLEYIFGADTPEFVPQH